MFATDALGRDREEAREDWSEWVGEAGKKTVQLRWMQCQNAECRQFVLEAHETHELYESGRARFEGRIGASGGKQPETTLDETWIAVPRVVSNREVNELVPEKYAKDYREAASILNLSPKSTAAIARKILADILEAFGGYSAFKLSTRIDDFINDVRHPSQIKENLHHLREVADFGVHTQKDTVTGEVVEVDHLEAEWTLDVVDGLFDYFIVGPARDAARRAVVDAKIARAGRRPIPPFVAAEVGQRAEKPPAT